MNFGSGGNTDAKAWKDIWGSGQGIGAVKAVRSVAERVARLEQQYKAAASALAANTAIPVLITVRSTIRHPVEVAEIQSGIAAVERRPAPSRGIQQTATQRAAAGRNA
jgi:hypothetical protein